MKPRRAASARQATSAAALALLFALYWPKVMGDDSVETPVRSAESASELDSESNNVPAISVDAYEFGFQPSTLIIRVGLVVSWRAVGEEPHLVTPASQDAAWVFFKAKRKGTVRHVFKQPGIYPYYCKLHPRQMRGTVIVRRDLDKPLPEEPAARNVGAAPTLGQDDRQTGDAASDGA